MVQERPAANGRFTTYNYCGMKTSELRVGDVVRLIDGFGKVRYQTLSKIPEVEYVVVSPTVPITYCVLKDPNASSFIFVDTNGRVGEFSKFGSVSVNYIEWKKVE